MKGRSDGQYCVHFGLEFSRVSLLLLLLWKSFTRGDSILCGSPGWFQWATVEWGGGGLWFVWGQGLELVLACAKKRGWFRQRVESLWCDGTMSMSERAMESGRQTKKEKKKKSALSLEGRTHRGGCEGKVKRPDWKREFLLVTLHKWWELCFEQKKEITGCFSLLWWISWSNTQKNTACRHPTKASLSWLEQSHPGLRVLTQRAT